MTTEEELIQDVCAAVRKLVEYTYTHNPYPSYVGPMFVGTLAGQIRVSIEKAEAPRSEDSRP